MLVVIWLAKYNSPEITFSKKGSSVQWCFLSRRHYTLGSTWIRWPLSHLTLFWHLKVHVAYRWGDKRVTFTVVWPSFVFICLHYQFLVTLEKEVTGTLSPDDKFASRLGWELKNLIRGESLFLLSNAPLQASLFRMIWCSKKVRNREIQTQVIQLTFKRRFCLLIR